MICNICPRHCDIAPGKIGACRARICSEDSKTIYALNYGKVTAAALDPIEKKPLRRFRPGSMIFSTGSFGCNLTCPFCQNHKISMTDVKRSIYKEVNPYQLLDAAERMKEAGNIGIAFTYNEPLIGYEFILDCARLFKRAGMDVVLVSNGYICKEPLDDLLTYIDAMNIDLKAFNKEFYERIGGDIETVKNTIYLASKECHVEVTTLIIPGENDSEEEMKREAEWLALTGERSGKDIPLHISRFFPAYDYSGKTATDISAVYKLADIARRSLKYVYTGNC
jgi:pyruvate formate lyase activating enzyme